MLHPEEQSNDFFYSLHGKLGDRHFLNSSFHVCIRPAARGIGDFSCCCMCDATESLHQLLREAAFDSAGALISNPHQGRLKPGFPEIFLEKFEILLGPMSDLMRQHHDFLVALIQTAAHSGFLEKTLEITLAVMRCITMRIQQDAIAANPTDAWTEDHPEGEVLRLVTWKDNSEFHIVN